MSDFHYVCVEDANASNVLEPIPTSSRESYSWTDDKAFQLIQHRMQYKELFTRKKGSATLGYKKIAENLGLGADNYHCVKKKWENMVDKFRQEIKKIIYGFESDNQPYLRSTWRYYDAMCNALGYEREVNRVKLTMMNTTSSSTSTSPQVEPIIEPKKRNRIMQNALLPQPTTNALQSQLQSCDPLTYVPHIEVKMEPSDFEFDAMFVQEEPHDSTIDNLVPKEEILIENCPIMHNTEIVERELIESTPEVTDMSTTEMATEVENSTSAAASTSQVDNIIKPAGVIQSNHGAASNALTSCSSSDDTIDVPHNKKSSSSKRGKKRKRQQDDEDNGLEKIWEYIKKGDEDIRNDFKQLIEIQRKTSEHIGTLVNYLINKDKK